MINRKVGQLRTAYPWIGSVMREAKALNGPDRFRDWHFWVAMALMTLKLFEMFSGTSFGSVTEISNFDWVAGS